MISNSDEAICPWTFSFSCESPYIHKGAAWEDFPNEKEGEMVRDGEHSDGLYAINDPRSCFFLDGRGTSSFFRSRRDAKGLRQPSQYRDWYMWCILCIYIYIYSLPRTRYTRKRHLQRAVSLRFKREGKREEKACMRETSMQFLQEKTGRRFSRQRRIEWGIVYVTFYGIATL